MIEAFATCKAAMPQATGHCFMFAIGHADGSTFVVLGIALAIFYLASRFAATLRAESRRKHDGRR